LTNAEVGKRNAEKKNEKRAVVFPRSDFPFPRSLGPYLAPWRAEMLRPENTHPGDQDAILRDADVLESTENSAFGRMSDSPSSSADAGLMDVDHEFDSDIDSDFNIGGDAREINMTDALSGGDRPELHSPVMSAMNAPGDIDIEELDDFTVESALPPDARLDPLEP